MNIASRALRPLVDFVYPPRCPLCGDGIAAGPGLCAACWETFSFPGEPACSLCQMPLSQGFADSVCNACQAHPPRHAGVAAAALYNESARQLVLKFKHGGRIGLATLMGRLMATRLSDMADDSVLVPVPLHRTRLWVRGYNQSALLARAIAKHTGHAVLPDALQRVRATPSLGGLGRARRAEALRGAIRVKPAHRKSVAGRHVILVSPAEQPPRPAPMFCWKQGHKPSGLRVLRGCRKTKRPGSLRSRAPRDEFESLPGHSPERPIGRPKTIVFTSLETPIQQCSP